MTKRLLYLISRKKSSVKAVLVAAVVLFMGNLNALIDSVFHPKIPYFDEEHLIVGGITASITLVLFGALSAYTRNLRIATEEIKGLNEELARKIEEKTRQLLDAQEELVRSEKLAVLGQLSAGISNELRNPLGVMNNAIYFLRAIIPDADERVKEYLVVIEDEIRNSQNIIEDLVMFSVPKAPRPRLVSVGELVELVFEKCAIPENVALSLEIPVELPTVNADPSQLIDILYNLIINAVQAMPEGGSLRIAARRVSSSEFQVLSSDLKPETLNLTPDGDFVEISVSDTGGGILPENLEKLFHPLFTTKARGIGLGLPISKNLVEANGGKIEVRSEIGKGTTFTVTLPAEVKGRNGQN